ncbi:SMAD/FHA domain-containing protein, partial [Westerdykella ornata]
PLPPQEQELTIRGLDSSSLPPTQTGGAPKEKEKPNFKPTGLLAKEANRVAGTKISLKYHEPPEARKPPPSAPWRLFIFKGPDTVGTIELGSQSCWLFGRAREVADVWLEHPSCSGQHAVIQFRYIEKVVEEDEFGGRKKVGKVKPYLIDLESSNGTELNGKEVEAGRYVELRDKDVLRFAGSEREYMIMLPPRE